MYVQILAVSCNQVLSQILGIFFQKSQAELFEFVSTVIEDQSENPSELSTLPAVNSDVNHKGLKCHTQQWLIFAFPDQDLYHSYSPMWSWPSKKRTELKMEADLRHNLLLEKGKCFGNKQYNGIVI